MLKTTLKQSIALILVLLLSLSVLISCGKGGDDSSLPYDESSAETSKPADETGITVTIEGTAFKVNAVNTDYTNHDVVLYDRNYTKEGNFTPYLPGSGEDRYILMVKRTVNGAVESYAVSDKMDDLSAKANVYIPVNGFTLSVEASLIPEKFKVRSGTKVAVSGYDNPPPYERMDLATVIHEDKNKSRRVFMSLPQSGTFRENKIYYIDKEDTVTVPENSVCVILKSGSGSHYSVSSLVQAGEKVSGTYALLFTGEYNVMYANEFYKDGKVYFTKLDTLNGITDTAAVKISGKYYTFDENHINSSAGTDGIFLYTPDNASLMTDKRGSFIDIVVVDGKVCYIGREDTPTLIPASHGYALSFAGSSKSTGKEIKIGDEIEGILIKDYENPDKFVKINGVNYPFGAMNEKLSENTTISLYTGIYGESTGNDKCVEISIENGKVVAVSDSGNSSIPQDGYVLAIANTETLYKNSARDIQTGDIALISAAGNFYGFTAFNYTAINGIRYTDYIVIYDGKEGKYTGTNIYGYEVGVNSEGKMISQSYAGNMEIPTGGFVISVHGDANIDMLKNLYLNGATVSLDKTSKTVSVYKTPELAVYNAALLLESQKNAFDNAKREFYSINYTEISGSLSFVQTTLDQAENAFDKGDIAKAAELANAVTPVLEKLKFSMYESLPVENRSVWYRANEKSDKDVLSTIQKMAAMNINAVYIEAWYDGKVIGFSDIDLIDHHTYSHQNYDALEGFCRIGHEYGIEIHVWVENFFIGVKGRELVNVTAGHHLLDKNGNNYCPTMYGDFVFLNPYDEYSQNLVMSIYREMIEKYDIDGLHLDYIRFPEPNSATGADFGYNDDIIAGFQSAYNTTANPKTMATYGKDWNNWCLFRESIINDWVEKVYTMAKGLEPDLIISCAVSSNYPGSRTTIFQNFNAWVEKGYMDEVFSMSYTTSLEAPVQNIKTFTRYTDGKCFYSIGLSAFENTPDYILAEQIKLSRENGAFGQNLFSWGSLIIHEENYFDALRIGIYSRKSVQTYKLSETVLAYTQRLIEDTDGVYAYLKPIEGDFYSSIKAKAENIRNQANAFDLDNAIGEQKAEYCRNAITALEELKTLMQGCPDENVSRAMVEDLVFIIDCLNTSLVRLTK